MLVNEQVRTAVTRELDAVSVVPFHTAAQDLAVRQHHRYWGPRLHLFNVVKILRVSLLRWRGFLALRTLRRNGLDGTRRELFLHIRKGRTKKFTVNHKCSFL